MSIKGRFSKKDGIATVVRTTFQVKTCAERGRPTHCRLEDIRMVGLVMIGLVRV